MEKTMVEQKYETPIRSECDVLVVGAGSAGIMAALSAAKAGARTILVEKDIILGGTMLGGCASWAGFYCQSRQHGQDPLRLVRGSLVDELLDRLNANHGISGFYEETVESAAESIGIHADREALPIVLQEMLADYGVKLYLRCIAVDALMEDGAVCGIVMQSKSGREAIRAKVTIDCSGMASVAQHAGANVCQLPERRGGGMSFGMGNVNLEKARAFFAARNLLTSLGYMEEDGVHRIARMGFRLSGMESFEACRQKYHLRVEPRITSIWENCASMIDGVFMDFDTTDPYEVSQAYVELNDCCHHMAQLFSESVPGFEDAYLDWTAPAMGLKFGLMVVCEQDISRQDIDEQCVMPDDVGVFAVPALSGGKGYCGLPYRALLPANTENLLVAGKGISSDSTVFECTRKVGACLVQGQAAGTAAAMAAMSGVALRALDIGQLRMALEKEGVFLG